ncbi:MAG: fibronectin type III domain-containing protein [Firmicutes bacterium]|nr:fibronectin type III domain-containing protein [Bacillota bacterium]
MKNRFKLLFLAVAILPCIFLFAACGANTAPSMPKNFAVTQQGTEPAVTLSWSASSPNEGSEIVKYCIESFREGVLTGAFVLLIDSTNADKPEYTYGIYGFDIGVEYTFKLTAINANEENSTVAIATITLTS